MENHLLSIGYIQKDEKHLTVFLSDLHLIYAEKKRKNILYNAHGIMKREYINSITITDSLEKTCLNPSNENEKTLNKQVNFGEPESNDDVTDGYFRLPSNLQVSKCAKSLVELVHETLLEACNAELKVKCVLILFHTARDVFMLFRAIVPTLYAADISNDARASMLFHNDCMYIAHHMLTIGHMYRPR